MLPRTNYLDLVAGQFKETNLEDLKGLFATFAGEQDGGHLVVHFHGGLVSRESALSAAESLLPAYRQAGAYPAFFIWNSDVWTTVTANLGAIAQERAFQRLVRRLVQLAMGAVDGVGGKGLGLDAPSLQDVPDTPEQLEAFANRFDEKQPRLKELTEEEKEAVRQTLSKDSVLAEEQQRIAAGLGAQDARSKAAAEMTPPLRTAMSPKVQGEIAAEGGAGDERAMGFFWTLARYGAEILAKVIKRYLTGRYHGLYTTVVQETLRALYLDSLGVLAWNLMKKNTLDAFGDGEGRGGAAFVTLLQEIWANKVQRLTLIGHSTGAIYIGHFLEFADKVLPAGVRCDVIFLAPACTFRFVHQRLEVFRRRVAHLRLFGLLDERERSYWEVPGVFRGSLLYIVAGLLEEEEVDMPLLGMQRYHSREGAYNTQEIAEVLDWLPEAPVWAVTDEEKPGRASGALFHGAFDREPRTLTSVQHIFRSGF